MRIVNLSSVHCGMDHHKLAANGPIVSIRGVARLRRTESIFSTVNHCRAKNTVMAECRARLPRSYRQWKESEWTLSVALALIDIGENVFYGLGSVSYTQLKLPTINSEKISVVAVT